MKRALSVIVFASLAAMPAFAEDKSDGCGVGWNVTKKHSLSATTTRGTTNSILPPTFSMTSGTSGCDKHSFVQRRSAAAVYAMTNHEALRLEMASGGGEYLEGFARTFGCTDGSAPRFASAMQKNYQRIYDSGSVSALEMSERVERVIQGDRALSAACGHADAMPASLARK